MVSAFFLSIATIVLLSAAKRGADLFSPGRIFIIVWSTALGLADLKLSGLQSEWSLTIWTMVLLAPFSLLTGVFVAYVTQMDLPVRSLDSVRESWRLYAISDRRLFVSIWILFVLYASSYLTIFAFKGFIPMLSIDGVARRAEFTLLGLGLLVESMPLIVFLSILYLLIEKRARRRRVMVIFFSIVATGSFLLLAQRFQLMMGGIMCVGLLYYTTHSVRLKTAAMLFASALLFFYWASTLRGGQLYAQYIFATSKMKIPSSYAVITEPYMYLVMNLENYAHAMNVSDHNTYGLFTFDFAFAAFGLKHWIRDYFALVDRPYVYSGYNTFGAFWTYYRDFGVLGITAIPFVLGYFARSIYSRMRRKPSFVTISTYAVVIFVLAISYFDGPLSNLWFVWLLLVLYVVVRKICPTQLLRYP
jgi:oligosaccharide repeat unit polymerase